MDRLIQKYTNEHSRFLLIDGTMIHYRIEGKGFPIVLLHGAFSSLHTFEAWTEELKAHYQVIRLDLPGFGLSGAISGRDYSIQHGVHYLHQFFRRLEINELYLVGSSLGGWLSWEYALHYPERVRRLILIAAAGFLDDKSIPLPFKMARTPFVNRVIKYTISRSVLESFVREVYYNQSKITPQLLERYYDLFAREGNPEAFFLFVNQRFIDNTLHLKKLKTPTLILWGKEDKWLPVENAHRFHHLIEANEMIIYEQTGHLPMEEIPHDSLEDLLAFLNKDIDNQSSNFGQMAQNWEAQA